MNEFRPDTQDYTNTQVNWDEVTTLIAAGRLFTKERKHYESEGNIDYLMVDTQPFPNAFDPDATISAYCSVMETDEEPHVEYNFFVHSKSGEVMAEMRFKQLDRNLYVLNHRLVQPEYRGKGGLGTQLLQEGETFFSVLANTQEANISLRVDAAQPKVMEWLQKNGYTVQPADEAKLRKIEAGGDDIVITSISGKPGPGAEYAFDASTPKHNMVSAIRVKFEKTIHAN